MEKKTRGEIMNQKGMLQPAGSSSRADGALDSAQFLTVKEVAKLFKVTPKTVRFWIKRGLLEALVFPNKIIRIPSESVVEFMNRYDLRKRKKEKINDYEDANGKEKKKETKESNYDDLFSFGTEDPFGDLTNGGDN